MHERRIARHPERHILIPIPLRLGRHLETRLRLAFLEKIPRLADRYGVRPEYVDGLAPELSPARIMLM